MNSTTEVIQELARLIQEYHKSTLHTRPRIFPTLEGFADWIIANDTHTNPHRYPRNSLVNDAMHLLYDKKVSTLDYGQFIEAKNDAKKLLEQDDNGPES